MERRMRPRGPLDAPYFVSVRLESGHECPAMLIDCGRGGVQLAFSPSEEHVGNLLNRELMILGLPKGLGADPDGVPGTVTWAGPERCGVRFERMLTLTDQQLQTVANSL